MILKILKRLDIIDYYMDNFSELHILNKIILAPLFVFEVLALVLIVFIITAYEKLLRRPTWEEKIRNVNKNSKPYFCATTKIALAELAEESKRLDNENKITKLAGGVNPL